jgi:hypothetical protein
VARDHAHPAIGVTTGPISSGTLPSQARMKFNPGAAYEASLARLSIPRSGCVHARLSLPGSNMMPLYSKKRTPDLPRAAEAYIVGAADHADKGEADKSP